MGNKGKNKGKQTSEEVRNQEIWKEKQLTNANGTNGKPQGTKASNGAHQERRNCATSSNEFPDTFCTSYPSKRVPIPWDAQITFTLHRKWESNGDAPQSRPWFRR